jgi:hypothetical protein
LKTEGRNAKAIYTKQMVLLPRFQVEQVHRRHMNGFVFRLMESPLI